MIEFFVFMEPESKLRARMGKFGAYTPEKTVSAERTIRIAARQALGKDFVPFARGVPLRLEVSFYHSKPKSVKRYQPTTKPDLDNMIKLVGDALNGELWHDDAQIVSIAASKFYVEDDFPGIRIRVQKFEF